MSASEAVVPVEGGRTPPPPPPVPERSRVDELPASSFVVWIALTTVVALLLWAHWAVLDEVSVGTGKVITTSREQVIQSLEGGILTRLAVREGDVVEEGQVLAELDRIRNEESVKEVSAKIRSLKATAARLQAEVEGAELRFAREVAGDKDLVAHETALYRSRRAALDDTVRNLQASLQLVEEELRMSEPLAATGSVSMVEVLRLRRVATEIRSKIADTRSQYQVRAREELAKVNADLETQIPVRSARQDVLKRSALVAPVRGVVKNVQLTTVGGVLAPGGRLMEISPLDDRLVVETRISPKDIALIHTGQRTTVKLSAYDYTIYGALKGTVERVSPDTLQDDVHRDMYYYRAYVVTERDHLQNSAGKHFPIVPGMVATVEIHTGQKTVADYLFKPFNKAREALRER